MSREKSRSTAATEASTSSPCWWPWRSLTCLKLSRSTITRPSGLWKRRLRSTSRARIERKARALASPVSSSVTAWRSTVACRLAFSIETIAWPARYSSSSSSWRENSRPWRAIESTPKYSRPEEETSARIGTAGGGAPRLGPAGIDGLTHGQRDHAVPVEPGGERVADAADRLLQLLA